MEEFNLTITLTEPLLGTAPKSKTIYGDYVGSKAPDVGLSEEELETVEDIEEKGWTGFHQVDGEPILYDYVLKGFFKSACYFLRQVPKSKSKGIRAYKKWIDGLSFVFPRRMALVLPEGGEMGVMERPLRAHGPKGERVALARSDTCPVGTTLTCTVKLLAGITEEHLREWLDYGQFLGLGQWRSGGWGRFTYEMEEVE